jgi:hypothetical protein
VVVLERELDVVSHDLELWHIWKSGRLFAKQLGRKICLGAAGSARHWYTRASGL